MFRKRDIVKRAVRRCPFCDPRWRTKKFSVQLETLVFGFREVSAFQKCIWLQLSTKVERKYIATLTMWCNHTFRFLQPAGDSLVFIFPLATMLTFTSAIGKLNVRVSWHHHMLLQVISQSYCQVFVKSYNFVFEKIDIEYAPYQKWQKNRSFCTHPLQINTPPTCTCFVKNPPENCVSA